MSLWQPLGDPLLDLGVNPRLVFNVRQALDSAWESWNIPTAWKDKARDYCRNVKIVVSGGFNPEKIRKFEKLGVPVDIYAVGSWLFNNNGGTVTDFTGDVVRVKVHGEWIDMAKVGRRPLYKSEFGEGCGSIGVICKMPRRTHLRLLKAQVSRDD